MKLNATQFSVDDLVCALPPPGEPLTPFSFFNVGIVKSLSMGFGGVQHCEVWFCSDKKDHDFGFSKKVIPAIRLAMWCPTLNPPVGNHVLVRGEPTNAVWVVRQHFKPTPSSTPKVLLEKFGDETKRMKVGLQRLKVEALGAYLGGEKEATYTLEDSTSVTTVGYLHLVYPNQPSDPTTLLILRNSSGIHYTNIGSQVLQGAMLDSGGPNFKEPTPMPPVAKSVTSDPVPPTHILPSPLPLEFHVERKLQTKTLDVTICSDVGPSLHRYVALPMAFEEVSGAYIVDPCLKLSPKEAQNLIDAFWVAGVRPSPTLFAQGLQEKGIPEGELKALHAHLDDMRKITFDLLSLKQ